jgi:hypothetical protein
MFHDRQQFEIFCYANVGRLDPVTARLQHLAEHWAFVTGWSDEQVAAKIRADKIDILVDHAFEEWYISYDELGTEHVDVYYACSGHIVHYLGLASAVNFPEALEAGPV